MADVVLRTAVLEMESGLVDTNLGGHVMKKRVALPGHGKRGSVRTLLAYQQGNKAFFVYGFAKNERSNINVKQLKALKLLAAELLGYPAARLQILLRDGELIEVDEND